MLAWYVGKGDDAHTVIVRGNVEAARHAWDVRMTSRSCRHLGGASTRNKSTRGASAFKAGMQHRDLNCVQATLGTMLIGSTLNSSMHEHRVCQAMQPYHHSHAITYTRQQHHQTYPTT
nr:hypothetical protein CFP56_18113 [Quercus suber]